MMASTALVDCYQLLEVEKTATLEQIRHAYHRALLTTHPDKRGSTTVDEKGIEPPSVASLKDAYKTLTTPSLRTRHDADLAARRAGPRPAAVLSLDDMEEGDGECAGSWTHACRCGGAFWISENQMERDIHLIGCSSCSETIWIGYVLAQE
jgi:diphthamide biosynthesis protein 4